MANHTLRDELAHSPVWDGLNGGVCIVSCSGGRDSVALACYCAELLSDANFTSQFDAPPVLALWHLDHGLRQDSARDAEFVHQLAGRLGVMCITERVELAKLPGNIEALARQVRYTKLLRLLVNPLPTDNLPLLRRAVTAHHLGDQVESLLHHLIRGTHLRGLRAIAPVYQQHVFRPWLNIPPESITAYLQARGHTWRDDPSNQDLRFTRNRIRQRILPELVQLNPQAREHIARLAAIARDAQAVIDQQVEQLHVEPLPAIGLMPWLPVLSAPRGRYFTYFLDGGWKQPVVLAEFIARQLAPRVCPLTAHDHETVTDWALHPLKPFQLHGVRISLHQQCLLILNFPSEVREYPVHFELGAGASQQSGRLQFELQPACASTWEGHQAAQRRPWQFIRHWPDFLVQRMPQADQTGTWTCFLPAETALPLTIQNWQPGDYLRLDNGGTKKVGDVFTDAKVPLQFRHCWAIVRDSEGRIIWVPGLADSSLMQVTPGQTPAWWLHLHAIG